MKTLQQSFIIIIFSSGVGATRHLPPLTSIRRLGIIHSFLQHNYNNCLHSPTIFSLAFLFFSIHPHSHPSLLVTCVSSLPITCPYQDRRFPFIFSVTGATFKLPHICSFLTLSILVTPHIHLNIIISATCKRFSSIFFTAQHSDSYITTGLITDLYIFPFRLRGIRGSHVVPVTYRHFIHPELIRCIRYVSVYVPIPLDKRSEVPEVGTDRYGRPGKGIGHRTGRTVEFVKQVFCFVSAYFQVNISPNATKPQMCSGPLGRSRPPTQCHRRTAYTRVPLPGYLT